MCKEPDDEGKELDEDARRDKLIETLRVSEARYRALVQAASDAVWVVDATAVAETNEGIQWWIDLTGQSAAEAGGWGWLEKVHPDDRQRVEALWTRAFQQGRSFSRWGSQQGRRLPERGGSRRACARKATSAIRGVGRHVHGRRTSPHRAGPGAQRRAVPRCSWTTGPPPPHHRPRRPRLYVSEGFRRMFRLPREAGRAGWTICSRRRSLGPGSMPDARPCLADAALEAVEAGIRADGTDGIFLTYRFPLRRRRNAARRQHRAPTSPSRRLGSAAAGQKMEAVGQLARGVAHDFNNVLTVIQGFSDRARGVAGCHELAEPVSEIKRAGERAAQLTGQLLALQPPRRSSARCCSISMPVVSDAVNMLRLVGEDIEPIARLLSPSFWQVKADPVQIDQPLLSLVSNARDAMPPQGGSLTLGDDATLEVGPIGPNAGQLVPPGNMCRCR